MKAMFSIKDACAKAWDVCWTRNLKARAKGNELYGYSTTYYLTASDLERQIRAFADEQAQGKPWGSSGNNDAYGSRIRIRTGRPGGLQEAVRDWLFDQRRRGVLESHNFNRGHISGERFRPRGEPIGEAEKSTLRRKESKRHREVPIHAALEGSRSLLCQQPASGHSYLRAGRGPRTRQPKDYAQVTCPRCLKLIKQGWFEVEYGVRLKWMGTMRLWSFRMRLCGHCSLPEAEILKQLAARHAKEGGKVVGWRLKAEGVGYFATAKAAATEAGLLWHWLKVDVSKMDWTLKDYPEKTEQHPYGHYPFSDALQKWEHETGVRLSHSEEGWQPRLAWRSK